MKESFKEKQLLIFLFLLVCFFVGVFSLYVGVTTKKTVSIKYREDNDVDYKVYLKDNNYFDSEYIGKDKTYITSLIDHIAIDFKYNINFEQKVNAKYKYKVMAQIEANKGDMSSGNYWTKKYDITDEYNNSLDSTNSYSIEQSVDIDYNKYNSLLNEFKKDVGLSNSEGLLKIFLIINSDVEGDKISTPVNSNLILKLPLSELAIEASIDSDISNKTKEVKKEVKEDRKLYSFLKYFGIGCLVLTVILLIVYLNNRSIYMKHYHYDVELKRILTTYDSIIVNIKDLPNLDDYQVIKVDNFDELIDAHSEIRMPINYYQSEKYSAFFLINDKMVWRYVLLKEPRRRRRK